MNRIDSVVADNSKKFIFVYQTKNLVNNKTYIGIHGTNKMEDKYLGGGIYFHKPSTLKNRKTALANSVRKYGFDNFVTTPMCFFDTYEEALLEESFLVDQESVISSSNYNMVCGGGKTIGRVVSDRTREIIKKNRSNQEVTQSMLDALTEGRKFGPAAVSKSLYCEANGKTYDSISSCARDLNLGISTVSRYVNGRVKNNFGLKFI